MKTKLCLVSLLLTLVMIALATSKTEAQAINVSFPGTVGPAGDTLDIPIWVDDLTGSEILGFGLTVKADTTVIVPLAALTEGTIASSWGVPTFNVIQDSIKIGIGGIDPLAGGGTLLFIRYAVNPKASVDDTSILHFADFLFNEGTPSNITNDGLFVVKPTGVEDDPSSSLIPSSYSLSQNYPNPFNSTTLIGYAIPDRDREGRPHRTTLWVYNILGQVVRTLVDGQQEAGYHSVRWESRDQAGREVASGIYFYRIKAGDFTVTRKMVLMR